MTVEPAATFKLRSESAHPDWTVMERASCPVCETRFEYLRIRDSAAQPSSRESDFRVVYRGADPSRYVVTVCPECSYASLPDDWADISLKETAALRAARGDRQGAPYLCGDRSDDDVATALDLALQCYAERADGERRRAGLLHRRAWVERARGDEEGERRWLTEARDAYREAYERDDAADAEAFRLAYLVGDLSLRLESVKLASQWLAEAVGWTEHREGEVGAEVPPALARMARDRLGDARTALRLIEGG